MNKKISLVLAIVMIASIFCMAMPVSVGAVDHAVEVDGMTETIEEASVEGWWECATSEVTVKITRDLTQEDFSGLRDILAIYNYNVDAEGNPVKVIFDFQGHTLTVTKNNFLQLGAAGAAPDKKSDVTIKNMNMVMSGVGSFCQIYAGGNYTFENCTFTATTVFNYCGINANMGDNTDNPANVTLTNVIMKMPADCQTSTGKQTSFIRTGNFNRDQDAQPEKDAEGKYTKSYAPIVNYVLNNCLLDASGELSEGNVGARGIHVTSDRSTVVLNQCTIKTGNACFYPDSNLKSFAADKMPGNNLIVGNDCILDNSNKNEAAGSKADPIYNGQFCNTTDNALVEDGFQGFEMMTPPVTEPSNTTEATPDNTTVATPDNTTVATPDNTTVATPDNTTATPDNTTATPDNTTAKPSTPTTNAPVADDEPAEEGCAGCGGFSVAASFLAIVCAAGAAIVIKKK